MWVAVTRKSVLGIDSPPSFNCSRDVVLSKKCRNEWFGFGIEAGRCRYFVSEKCFGPGKPCIVLVTTSISSDSICWVGRRASRE